MKYNNIFPIRGVRWEYFSTEKDALSFYRAAVRIRRKCDSVSMFSEDGQWVVRISNW
jgi:hypothetical protein